MLQPLFSPDPHACLLLSLGLLGEEPLSPISPKNTPPGWRLQWAEPGVPLASQMVWINLFFLFFASSYHPVVMPAASHCLGFCVPPNEWAWFLALYLPPFLLPQVLRSWLTPFCPLTLISQFTHQKNGENRGSLHSLPPRVIAGRKWAHSGAIIIMMEVVRAAPRACSVAHTGPGRAAKPKDDVKHSC